MKKRLKTTLRQNDIDSSAQMCSGSRVGQMSMLIVLKTFFSEK